MSTQKLLSLRILVGILLCTPFLLTAQAADVPANAETRYHTDAKAGYTFLIPTGYQILTPEQHQAVLEGVSSIAKESTDRVHRDPPSWFLGPVDPKRPKGNPPSFGIGYTDLDEPIDPTKIAEYKAQHEEDYRKKGTRYGDLKLSAIKVAGIDSLRLEQEVFSTIDNSRSQVIKVSVPGPGRRYEIAFAFHPDQAESVEKALAVVLDTFKIDFKPAPNPQTQSKWARIAYWTIGCFVAGILLSLLLKMLSGVGEKEPEESGG